MNNMNRLNKFLKSFWLIVSILSIILVSYVYINLGFENNLTLLFLPLISIGMYIYRRVMYSKFKDNYK
jgi:uncharacterized membrane protein